MTLDKLRSLLIVLWTATWVLCVAMGVVAGIVQPHSLSFPLLKPYFRDLSAALVPTISLMVVSYFAVDLPKVRATSGQKLIILLLSCLYLVAIVVWCPVTLFGDYFRIGETGIGDFSFLVAFLPLIVGPISFIFGQKGSMAAHDSPVAAKDPEPSAAETSPAESS